MLLTFAETERLVFRGTGALERGHVRSKESGNKSVHFNGSTNNIVLLLQVVISVNQLSICGAVADMIEELPVGQRALVKPKAQGQLDKVEIITQLPLAKIQANEERQGNLLQEYEQRFEKLSEDQKLSKLCSEAGLRLVEIGQFFYALPSPREEGNQSLCGTRVEGWSHSNVRFGPVSDIKVCNQNGRYSIEVRVPSLFQDQTVSWIRIVNGIDKFARETMPIQEEERASGIPAELYSNWTEKMDGYWNTGIKWSLLFSSVEIHHLTTTTQSKSSSRRWWSSPLWPSHWRMHEKQFDNTEYWSVSWDEEGLRQCSALVDWKMDISSGKRSRTEEKVSILRKPDLLSEIPVPSSNPRTLRKYYQSCIARQCTVTRRFYRVYLSQLRSLVNHGLIPGGVSLRTGRRAVFFTVVNAMDDQDGLGETVCDLSQARIAPFKKYLETLSEYRMLVQFEVRSTKRTAILSNKVKRSYPLWHTACRVHWESGVHEDQGYQRESVILRPRVVLEAYSQCGSQYLLVQEARSSWESQQDAESHGETRSNTADCRILGFSISTVKLQDARRQNKVTKLIEMFEKHQHKEQLLEDMSQKQEINKFSEESQQLVVDMNHTEIFELCENSAKHQCPDCNAFSEIGIIYCSCARNLKYSRSPTTFQKTHCDFTSIPGFVIKKNSSRGPKHGVSERQVMFYKAKQMLKKARQGKHENHPTILSRWYEQEGYRKSLAEQNIGEKEIMLFDRIALEKLDFSATKAERLQNAKHWILRLNADGPRTPFSTATRICRCIKNNALKCKTFTWRKRGNLLRPIRPEHQQGLCIETMPHNARRWLGGNAAIS